MLGLFSYVSRFAFCAFFLCGITALSAQSSQRQIQELLAYADSVGETEPRPAITAALDALQLAQRKRLDELQIDATLQLGNLYSRIAEYDSALSYFLSAEGLVRLNQKETMLPDLHVNIGAMYTYLQEFDLALDYYRQGLEASDDPLLRRRILHNSGYIYHEQGQFEEAERNFKRSLAISRQRNDSSYIANTLNMLGEVSRHTGAYDEAKTHYEDALRYFDALEIPFGRLIVLNNLGTLYLDQGQLDEAQAAYARAYRANELLGNKEAEVTLLSNMGVIARLKRNYEAAIDTLTLALTKAREADFIHREIECLEELHEALALDGQFEQAYEVQQRFVEMRDSLQSVRNEQKIAELTTRFKLVERNQELAFTKTKNQRYYLALLGLGALLLGVLGLAAWQRTRSIRAYSDAMTRRNEQIAEKNQMISESNKALRDSNQELKEFAYIVSHDLKEPLRMIGSYVTLIDRRYGERLDRDGRDFIDFAVQGVRQMKLLLDDLLAYMVVETQDHRFEAVELNEVWDRLQNQMAEIIEENDARIDVEPLPIVYGKGSLLALVFQNLLSNALKFRGEAPPVVRAWAEPKGDMVRISVQDNGIGLPEESLEKVFHIFHRVNGKYAYEGTGIGLAICRKIVNLHGGKIWAESDGLTGSTFSLTLPLEERPPLPRLTSEPQS